MRSWMNVTERKRASLRAYTNHLFRASRYNFWCKYDSILSSEASSLNENTHKFSRVSRLLVLIDSLSIYTYTCLISTPVFILLRCLRRSFSIFCSLALCGACYVFGFCFFVILPQQHFQFKIKDFYYYY